MKIDDPDKQLAAALGRVVSGIYVLTVKGDQAETGMLASWVQQCSFRPPLITVAVQPNRPIATLFTGEATFTLNVLDDGQTDMIVHFGRGFALADDAFKGLDVQRGGPGGPILAESLAVLECRMVGRHSAGDHDLIIGAVTAGRLLTEGHPMVHIRKNGFHY